MRWGNLASVALAILLLSGCTSMSIADMPGHGLVSTDVDPMTVPGFVSGIPGEEDVIPDVDVATLGIDPESIRYQGEWDDWDVYLGVSGTSTVHVITVSLDNPEDWGSGNSIGNSVLGLGDPTSLQYLPQGTSHTPDGWHPLSDWVIVRD